MKIVNRITSLIVFFTLFSCLKTGDKIKQPNIILIVADDLGWTDASFMGSNFYETPNIDKLSKSGMTFYNGYASSANCAPSRATMLSGKYQTKHGIYTVGTSERGNKKTRKIIPIKNKTILDLDFFIIPEMLKTKGYINGHFGKWHMGPNGFYPEQRGFDLNIGGNEKGGPGKGGYFSPYLNPTLSDGPNNEYLTDRLGNEVVNFIESNKKNSFFAYVPFYSVHTPIQSKKSYQNKYSKKVGDDKHNRADYAGMIQSLDENGLRENTIIVFTSDNGLAVGQHGLMGKQNLYEHSIKVPLIIQGPGIPEGMKDNQLVYTTDLFPTICDLTGKKKPKSPQAF